MSACCRKKDFPQKSWLSTLRTLALWIGTLIKKYDYFINGISFILRFSWISIHDRNKCSRCRSKLPRVRESCRSYLHLQNSNIRITQILIYKLGIKINIFIVENDLFTMEKNKQYLKISKMLNSAF